MENAASTARALVAAEADGQKGHGLSRVPAYAAQAKAGKVNGRAVPKVVNIAPVALRIDASLGFAYPAIDAAIHSLMPLTKAMGVATAIIHRSHHFGQAGAHVERLADQGLIALMFGNSPKAMAFWGGTQARLGTNPIAFACPMPGGAPPLVIDLALSVTARGKVMAAEQRGEDIPQGWALDAEGRPTSDPKAALSGTMLPIGGAKGAALALMVEILAAGLSGSHFGWEASSFFDDKGSPPDMGHVLLAIDPHKLSGGAFFERLGVLLNAMAEEPDVRLPGLKRLAAREAARANGLDIPAKLYEDIVALTPAAPNG